jgi:2-keto-4-pentenoate hydratase
MGNGRLAWADFGLNHGLVCGAPVMPPPLDALADAVVVARVDGDEVGRGTGAEVLGHPLEALAWLTRQGCALVAGDLVSTGTCTGIAPIINGQRAEADFGPFGRVGFRAA